MRLSAVHVLGPLWVDKKARFLFFFSIFANLLSWVLLVSRLWPLLLRNSVISLHYSIYQVGINAVGAARYSLLVPAFGILMLALNATLARMLYPRERTAALVAMVLTAGFEILVFISVAYVVLLNLQKT